MAECNKNQWINLEWCIVILLNKAVSSLLLVPIAERCLNVRVILSIFLKLQIILVAILLATSLNKIKMIVISSTLHHYKRLRRWWWICRDLERKKSTVASTLQDIKNVKYLWICLAEKVVFVKENHIKAVLTRHIAGQHIKTQWINADRKKNN